MEREGGAGAYLSLAAAVVFWGLSFVATKVALESLPVFTLVFARFGTSACLFAVLLARRGFPRFSRKNRGKMLLLSIFEPVLYFVFETYGLKLSPAAKVSLIIATVPVAVVTAFGAWILIGETLTPLQMSGGVLVIAGVFLTNLPGIYRSANRKKTVF